MKQLEVVIEGLSVILSYDADDLIWNLPPDKRLRKGIADAQRILAKEADRLSQTPVTVWG